MAVYAIFFWNPELLFKKYDHNKLLSICQANFFLAIIDLILFLTEKLIILCYIFPYIFYYKNKTVGSVEMAQCLRTLVGPTDIPSSIPRTQLRQLTCKEYNTFF